MKKHPNSIINERQHFKEYSMSCCSSICGKKSDLISYNPSFYPQDLKVELVNVLKEILGSLKACFSSQTFLSSPILNQETISTVITNTPSNLR